MFPPHICPPGCYVSGDGIDVVTPVSVTEWFINFYHEMRDNEEYQPMEIIQRPGDLVFIPSGWYHMVINLEESVAVTQNFVNEHNLLRVLKFLKNKPDKRLWKLFSEKLQRQKPELWQMYTDREASRKRKLALFQQDTVPAAATAPTTTDSAAGSSEGPKKKAATTSGFTFGFSM
jgi:hypothetical protein